MVSIIWGFGSVVVAVAYTCAGDGGGLAAAAVSAAICAIRVLIKFHYLFFAMILLSPEKFNCFIILDLLIRLFENRSMNKYEQIDEQTQLTQSSFCFAISNFCCTSPLKMASKIFFLRAAKKQAQCGAGYMTLG
ncbi:hypothetical protein FRACYDRAFT_234752 [Fragilariopsis cylindrus CCMP1102]|uniref:Uncharacterized protein n=1 Tax=Fragilariopsis cylindrus CCMP1102 TaxID=635003 RepID=A0A1E7FSQ9_9STRA|nr:hypothetical protein FRACYDRAFT_234752 [Fragilariopsis cylindrus CCMP1102]|eukprot:OEU21125.1 hypothetical protein FRACYDRAFT_234752 [Fragilariopsis cylindrus CCMP1102]